MCKHDVKALVGTARGIECRDCGAVFENFAALEEDRKAQGKKTEKKGKGKKND